MIRRFTLPLVLLLALAASAAAAPRDAVARMPSHGGSATVIYTAPGRSLLLTCAHCFRGPDRDRRIRLDVPHNAPGPHRVVGARLLAVDRHADLALVELNDGPLPFVCPVANAGTRPGRCLSVGYDEMRTPPAARPATVLWSGGDTTWTRQRPWHGRSGGALIDESTGRLVGVVSGYTGRRPRAHVEVLPGTFGVYVSLSAVRDFVGRHAPEALTSPERQRRDQGPPPANDGWRMPRLPAPSRPACPS